MLTFVLVSVDMYISCIFMFFSQEEEEQLVWRAFGMLTQWHVQQHMEQALVHKKGWWKQVATKSTGHGKWK